MGRYTVELVGESNYQEALARLQPSDRVKLVPEPGNAFDPRAVRCINIGGETLGYLERDSWLTRAMLDDGTAVASRIKEIVGGYKGKPSRGLVLEVLTGADAEAALAGKAAAPVAGQAVAAPETMSGLQTTLVVIGVVVGLSVVITLNDKNKPAEPKPAAAAASVPADPKVKTAALAGWFKGLIAKNRVCEQATKELSETIGSLGQGGDRYTGYQQAMRVQDVCREAWADLTRVDPPQGLSDAGRATAETTVDNCGMAALTRQTAAKAAAKVLDGDMRPSAISEAKGEFERVGQATMACVAGGMKLASDEGLDVAEFSKAVAAE